MIKIENTDTYGWEAAIRGMRNPFNSWDKSDSGTKEIYGLGYAFVVGPKDLALMQKLAAAGTDHSKYLRMITVMADITAPLYWWKEFDTYKVGTVANSCSTMHTIANKEFTLDDFSHEHLHAWRSENGGDLHSGMVDSLRRTVKDLNYCRERYLEMGDKNWWWQMIQLLPSSYNQRRTVLLNYQVAHRMHEARKNHKLDEWHVFCDWVETLPYYREIFWRAIKIAKVRP